MLIKEIKALNAYCVHSQEPNKNADSPHNDTKVQQNFYQNFNKLFCRYKKYSKIQKDKGNRLLKQF